MWQATEFNTPYKIQLQPKGGGHKKRPQTLKMLTWGIVSIAQATKMTILEPVTNNIKMLDMRLTEEKEW